jgi:hypothetical protein
LLLGAAIGTGGGIGSGMGLAFGLVALTSTVLGPIGIGVLVGIAIVAAGFAVGGWLGNRKSNETNSERNESRRKKEVIASTMVEREKFEPTERERFIVVKKDDLTTGQKAARTLSSRDRLSRSSLARHSSAERTVTVAKKPTEQQHDSSRDSMRAGAWVLAPFLVIIRFIASMIED